MAQFKSNVALLWKRGILRGLVTVWREREWATALSALVGVFLLFQLIIFMLLGVQAVQSLLRSRTDLRLELQATAAEPDIQQFLAEIHQLPYVDNSVYIPKQKAYEQMQRKDPELIKFLEEFNLENPFPDTVGVTLLSLNNFPDFDAFISEARWQNVVDPAFLSQATEQEAHVYELLRLTNAGRSIAMLFLLLTTGIVLFVTTELIRRRVIGRSEEVLVEHLSGAQSFGILIPFATEASVLLLIAVLGSAVILLAILMTLPMIAPTLGDSGALRSLTLEMSPLLRSKFPLYILIEVLCAPLLGWFGAWLGVLPKIGARSLAIHRQ